MIIAGRHLWRWAAPVRNRLHAWRHSRKPYRCLEIGPGDAPVPGFETLDVVGSRFTDYIADAGRRLPLPTATFDVVYASHVLEHIPWYQTAGALAEWVRVLKPGGKLDVWVPDGLRICAALVDAELGRENRIHLDGWYRYNPEKDPCIWAAGRLYTYGDGSGATGGPNWHRSLFTPRYLAATLRGAGLQNVAQLDASENRGHGHGWIDLGFRGTKP